MQEMIAIEMEISTSHCKDHVLTGVLEYTPIGALHVGYDAIKRGVKTFLRNLVREEIVNIISQGKMDSLLMRMMESLTQSDSFMEA